MSVTKCSLLIALTISMGSVACTGISSEIDSEIVAPTNDDQKKIIADFRAEKKWLFSDGADKVDTAQAHDVVERALGGGASERYRLAASVEGHFTQKEQQQTLHVIVNRKVTAASKEVIPSILVIFQANKPITQFVLDKASYIDIESVLDISSDGLHEVLLTAAAYQMGSLFIAADLYGFNEPDSLLKQELGVVYANTCDAAIANSRQIRASVLSVTADSDALMSENFESLCSEKGGSTGIESFVPASSSQ